MTIFITGGTGFIGRHVVRKLLASGHELRVLVRPGSCAGRESHERLRWIEAEMNAVPAGDLKGCDALIHLAAHGVSTGLNDWEGCFSANVVHSLALWRMAARQGVERLVICGSCFEYGRSGERYDFIPVDAPLEPTGAYHASKAAASMAAIGLAHELKLDMVILRPFHVYGEGEGPTRFWPSLKAAALKGDDFPMTEGRQVRDFVPVEEVATVFAARVEAPVRNARPSIVIENIGTGAPVSLLEFARHWWAKFGASGRLLPGAVACREGEVMRYVPLVTPKRP